MTTDLQLAKVQLRAERERRLFEMVRMVAPALELVGTAVTLNWLVQRGKERLPNGQPKYQYVWLAENLATLVGTTVGAAVVAQQLGPQGIQALGQGSADVLKALGALTLK